METRWLYTTSNNFTALREAAKDTCIIPMGCIEKHGPHLPLGTDVIEASAIAYEASQLEPICIGPDFAFGDTLPAATPTAHPGYITISLNTMITLLEELCDQAAKNGFTKIAVLNFHGGNGNWLSTFARHIQSKKKDYDFFILPPVLMAPHKMAEKIIAEGAEVFPELTKEDVELLLKYHAEKMQIGHGGFGETSIVMSVTPESVKLDALGEESGLSNHMFDYLAEAKISYYGWDAEHPNAYSGHDPIGCNERIGKAAMRMTAEHYAKQFKVLKDDTLVAEVRNKRQMGW